MRGVSQIKKAPSGSGRRDVTMPLDGRAGDNAAGFHPDFRNGDINNVGHFECGFAFDLHGTALRLHTSSSRTA